MIITTTDRTGKKYLAWVDPSSASIMWVHNKSKAQNYTEEKAKELIKYISESLQVNCNAE